MKRMILLATVIMLFGTSWLFSKENYRGGHKVMVATDTLVKADTSSSGFEMIWTEDMQGEYYLTWEIGSIDGDTKWKLFHIYGNDTTVMVDTVKVDSAQAVENDSQAAKFSTALYHEWLFVSFGDTNDDSITVKCEINAAAQPRR